MALYESRTELGSAVEKRVGKLSGAEWAAIDPAQDHAPFDGHNVSEAVPEARLLPRLATRAVTIVASGTPHSCNEPSYG